MSWRDRIDMRKGVDYSAVSPLSYLDETSEFKDGDVGIKNKNSDSFLKISDSGTISIFSSSESGLVIEPDGEIKIIAGRLSTLGKRNRSNFSGEKEINDFIDRIEKEYIETRGRNGLGTY